MNSRARFLAVIAGEKVDHPPLFPEGIREEVLLAWRAQGLAEGATLGGYFHYDEFEQLDPDVYPRPEIADWSDPKKLLPMLRRRLDADDPRRLPADWEEQARRWQGRDFPLLMRIHPGLLLSLGVADWRSFAPALLRLVDEPETAQEIMAIQAEFAARLAEKILRQVDVDGAIFSEPIAGNHGPLISPEMYRRFALESYRPVFDVLRAHQVPAIIWRSYANPDRLLPEVMKHPFNAVWLCERPPGALAPAQLRELIGGQATLIGGIDGDVLRQDREAIRQAVAAARRLAAAGRFIPLADGRVRGDAPYTHYTFYRQELERAFRGQGDEDTLHKAPA